MANNDIHSESAEPVHAAEGGAIRSERETVWVRLVHSASCSPALLNAWSGRRQHQHLLAGCWKGGSQAAASDLHINSVPRRLVCPAA